MLAPRNALFGLVLLTTLAAGPARAEPVEFDRALAELWAIAACAKPAPESRFPKKEIETHCKGLDQIFGDYEKRWATPARPFFAGLVPADVPRTIVYPFGGADLLTALAIFPDLAEINSISLEAGGDPRSFLETSETELVKHLGLHRAFMAKLVKFNHSKTLDLALLKGTPLPSQMIFALIGLKVHGYEPVGLRATRLNADGTLHYFTAADLAAADKQADGLKGSSKNRKLNDLFAGYELRFKKRDVANAPVQVYRHFQANLGNDELAKDPRILRYLEGVAKRGKEGRFTAMTKAASYLLWWGNFKTIREFLVQNMAWMISDSTGVPPHHLDGAVWEQEVHGRFLGTFLKSSAEGIAAFRALYDAQPKRPLPFDYFGYPDNRRNGHLIITRRK